MKSIVLFTLSLFIFFSIHAQSFNTEITTGKQPVLLGKINKEKLSEPPYADWFAENYTAYQPDPEIINQLQNELSEYTITAFLGTWCGDSKREVPKFYKLLDEANFSLDRLTTVGVSRDKEVYKQSPGGEEEGLYIARVPTFIFYKDGKEVNRFVERPIENLESDILQLVTGNYASSYQIIAKTGQLLRDMGAEIFQKKTKKLARKLQPISKNHYELNAFSTVLFFANKVADAIAIARLNVVLYPGEADTYIALANKLTQTNNQKEAKILYKKALTLDPENTQATAALESLK